MSRNTPQMKTNMNEVTVSVYTAKKNIQRRSGRMMNESAEGNV